MNGQNMFRDQIVSSLINGLSTTIFK